MGMKKVISVLAVFAMILSMSQVAFAAVPDFLDVSEQPDIISADGESCIDMSAQLMARYDDGHEEPVKMCSVHVVCESQNPNVLQSETGEATAEAYTDEFGKASMKFCSTGSEEYNTAPEGEEVEIICRALQLEEDSSTVLVDRVVEEFIEVTKCPDADVPYEFENVPGATADILADGESHVYITGQLKGHDCNDEHVPVKKAGTMRFKSLNTNIVKTCMPAGTVYQNMQGQTMTVIDDGAILVETDDGVAMAEFCSAGAGSENVGTADIHVESVTYLNVPKSLILVETTSQYGTTYKDGFIALSAMPDQILADGESCLKVCAQTRDQDYRIIKKSGWEVSFESDNVDYFKALNPISQTDLGLASEDTNAEGIAVAEYCSSGAFDDLNVGVASIRAVSLYIEEQASVEVETKTSQIWPTQIDAEATMDDVLCDGESTTTVTAQLLDRCGLAVKMEGRLVNFKSEDTSLLTPGVISVETDEYGQAKATFDVADCKYAEEDEVDITVSTMSPQTHTEVEVDVVKPKGFVPDGVNTYTDQYLPADMISHAKPFVIAADGLSPVEVTAQVCEWEGDFCNPVKRAGVEIQFEVEDTMAVEARAADNPDALELQTGYVKLLTDDEGKATAHFRSTGDSPFNKNICSLIKVTGKNGEIFEKTAGAEVCTKGYAGVYPNALWIWAEPAFITADGTSYTHIKSALYYCYDMLPEVKSLDQSRDGDYSYLTANCKPVKMPGVTVKFETLNTDALDDGMGGYKIYCTTDEFGQAEAFFQSKGFDKQHMGSAEIEAWTIGSGENVIQLNTLVVGLEEKTWPWCPPFAEWFAEGSPEATADQDHDQYITDNELIEYIINVWMQPYSVDNPYGNDDAALIQVILAWLAQ